MSPHRAEITSVVWATDIDVLASDHLLERRADHWVVRSPSNPTFWWGNFLLFDDPPKPGDGKRWQSRFADAFGDRPEVSHLTFAWDRTDGEVGEAQSEFVARGFELEATVGLTAAPQAIRSHPRANQAVEVVALDPAPGRDEGLWDQVVELQLAEAPAGVEVDYHRQFLIARLRGLRERFRCGDGAWYVALEGGGALGGGALGGGESGGAESGDVALGPSQVVGSLGIVVTDGRARYQTVDTAVTHRRRGIATRLVAEAARHASSQQTIDAFVMVADPAYHAISIYESLGFVRTERVTGVLRKPRPEERR